MKFLGGLQNGIISGELEMPAPSNASSQNTSRLGEAHAAKYMTSVCVKTFFWLDTAADVHPGFTNRGIISHLDQ